MKKIRLYGVDNTGLESVPQAYEPPAEVKARYRNFKILTISALVLLFILLAQSMIFVAVRLLFQQELYVKMIALGMEVTLVVAGIAICVAYQYIYHSLSYVNMGVIITTELILLVGQLVVCNLALPILYYCLIAFSVIFVLYAMILLNCGVKFKLAIAVVPVLVLVITNFIYLQSLEFTPRYIYISTEGYNDKLSDESDFYYRNPVNEDIDGWHAMDEIIELTSTMSNARLAINKVKEAENTSDSLEYLNSIYSRMLPMGDVVNFNEKYNDDFFKDYSLYFSVLELENPNDTIECAQLQYSFKYARPIIKYNKSSTENKSENQRAVCVMVFEIPVEIEQAIMEDIAGFTTDRAVITYR